MKNPLSAVKQLLTELTFEEKKEIYQSLKEETAIADALEFSEIRPKSCRCCGGEKFTKNGKEVKSGRQRYLCKDCKKTFTSMTGTVLNNMQKKGEFIRYVASLIENQTLKDAAETHGIALNTSFNWRHRLLSALGLASKEIKAVGEIQADENSVSFPSGGAM
jgi:transposase-like protein